MLQTGEIIVILLLALVVLGPKRLPDLARKMGRWTSELRAAAREITQGLQAEVDDIKAVGRELKAPMDEVKKPFTEIRDEMSGFGPEGREWKGPKPVSGPTPEDAMRDLEEMNRIAEEEGASGDDEPSPAEETGDAADERSE
jgi:Tat protein translocase TatB subunit